MKRVRLYLVLTFFIAVHIHAQTPFLSITNQGQALVYETRDISVKKGVHSLQIADLPTQLDFSSVLVDFASGGISLEEQIFLYDLNDLDRILNAAIGQKIRLIHPESGPLQGTLLSLAGGTLVLETFEKEIRLVPSYLSGQIAIEKPEGGYYFLGMSPVLSWTLKSDQNKTVTANLSYLTRGLNWQAEYAAVLSEDEAKLTLSSRVIISNHSGKNFSGARLQLIAGELHQATPLTKRMSRSVAGAVLEMADSPDSPFEAQKGFEYYTYDLERPLDIASNQEKSILFFPGKTASVTKSYNFDPRIDASAVSVRVKMINSRMEGPGIPLPQGRVRLYKKPETGLLFIGEDQISHVPVDEEISLEVGKAFDLLAERTVLERQRDGKNSERTRIAVELRNRKNEDVLIRVTEPIVSYRSYRLISSNFKSHRQVSDRIEFDVPVPAGKSETLTFELIYTW